jgi:hypothetical protein
MPLPLARAIHYNLLQRISIAIPNGSSGIEIVFLFSFLGETGKKRS